MRRRWATGRPSVVAYSVACLAAVAAVTAMVSVVPAGAVTQLPVRYNALAGNAAQTAHPNASPPGANDWSCRPPRSHPRPVVLLHGFFTNQTGQWQTTAPLLHNAGYCVFSLTYGTDKAVDPTEQLGGLDYIQNSSRQVAAFVNRVLAATHSARIDLVGSSEGGLLGRWYIKFDGGATRVHTYVGLAPANGPTNLSQVAFALARLNPAAAALVDTFSGRMKKVVPFLGQAVDRHLFDQLNRGGGTVPSVYYTNIASRFDEIVPPAVAFIPRGVHVRNIVLQDGCPIDTTDHLAIDSVRRGLGFMLNALDPATARTVPCVPVVPGVGSL